MPWWDESDPPVAPNVTGWWAELHESFTVALSPAVTLEAGSQYSDAVGITVTPQVSMAAAGTSVAGFTAQVSPQVSFDAPHLSEFGVLVTPQLSMVAEERYPAAFGVSVSPSLVVTGEESFKQQLQISVAPTVSMDAAERYAAAFAPMLSLSLSMAGEGVSVAGFAVAVTPSVVMAGDEHYDKSVTMSVTPSLSMDVTENYDRTMEVVVTPSVSFAAELITVSPVAYQATGAGNRNVGSGTPARSATWTHDCPASDAKTVVFAAVAFGGVDTSAPSGNVTCTYNGVAMTALGAKYGIFDGTDDQNQYIWLFYLFNPPTGSVNVVATWPSGNNKTVIMGNSVSYTGVGSLGTRVQAQATLTTAFPVTVNGTDLPANSMAIAATVRDGTIASVTQTQRHISSAGSGTGTASYADSMAIQDVVGDGTNKTLSGSGSNNRRYSTVAVPLLPA